MNDNAKQIPVIRSSMPSFDEYVEAIRPLWDSRWLTNMGKNHEKLTEELEKYLKVHKISLFTNGHMALELCLQAMNLHGEVITTPFTFVSTTHAIVRNGLKPVFCDIKPDDFTMDPDKIEELITEETSAIVPVHVYGMPCDVEAIEKIAKKHGLKVIYDAAHAFGVELGNRSIGSYGDASMFSFHATKVYHTIEGGAIATEDEDLIYKLWMLKDFGIKDEEIVDGIGANAKMNEFAAAMGLCNLLHVDEDINRRKMATDMYRNLLKNVPGITVLPKKENVKLNYAYFPIVVNEKEYGHTRDELKDVLSERNVKVRKYFYPLCSDMDCYKGRFDSDNTPVAKYVSDRVLTIPLYAEIEADDVDYICNIISDFSKS